MSNVISKTQCPKCASNGADKSHNNLVTYEDGGSYCFACGYSQNMAKGKPTFALPDVVQLPSAGWKSKGIPSDVLKTFGVAAVAALDGDGVPLRKAVDTDKGVSHEMVPTKVLIQPYYDLDSGKLVAAKTRDLANKDASGRDEQKWRGDIKSVTFFGVNALRGKPTLVITEGETDTMSIYKAVTDVDVLGVPGASTITKAIKNSLHFLKRYNKIVVLMDSDTAGQEAVDKAVEALPNGRVWVASYPMGTKDANEMVVKGLDSELRRVVREARQLVPKGVVEKGDLKKRTLDYMFNRKQNRGPSTGFDALDRAIGGLSPGKMVTVCAGTGSGKSTFVEALALGAARSGVKTFMVPLEMTDTEVVTRMVQQVLKQPIVSDPDFDVSMVDRDELEQAIEFVNERLFFFDHYGSLELKKLIEVCEFAIDAYGCKVIVLDHLTAASESLEWKDLDKTAKLLKHLALSKGVCVILVNHISRDGENENEVPSLKHIRGGNGVAQYSDCVLGIGRKRDENVMTVRTIKVDRMVGKFVEFQLVYQDCSLLENGVTFDEMPKDTQNEDENNGSSHFSPLPRKHVQEQTGGLQEPVRSTHSTSEPEAGLRSEDIRVPTTSAESQEVYGRLVHRRDEQSSREQGSVRQSRQGQDATRSWATSRVALLPPLPELNLSHRSEESDDIPSVVLEEQPSQ